MPILIEACIDSVASAINAEKGGASRVELCANLVEGGTTPSLGMFNCVKSSTRLPVFVMVRPRGGDFLYSDIEYGVMREEIKIFSEHGADGFVFGILTNDGHLDKDRNRELVSLCQGKPTTFHRAIDMCTCGTKALEDIIDVGFQRVLTSGMEATCLEGLDALQAFVKQAGDRLIVVPGGGITEINVQRIIAGCFAKEIHMSGRSQRDSAMEYRNSTVHMGAGAYSSEYVVKTTSAEKIRRVIMKTENALT